MDQKETLLRKLISTYVQDTPFSLSVILVLIIALAFLVLSGPRYLTLLTFLLHSGTEGVENTILAYVKSMDGGSGKTNLY